MKWLQSELFAVCMCRQEGGRGSHRAHHGAGGEVREAAKHHTANERG